VKNVGLLFRRVRQTVSEYIQQILYGKNVRLFYTSYINVENWI